MRGGKSLVLFQGTVGTKWADYNDDKIFPVETIFNQAEFLKSDNYLKLVKEEDMVDLAGNNVGVFHMHADF